MIALFQAFSSKFITDTVCTDYYCYRLLVTVVLMSEEWDVSWESGWQGAASWIGGVPLVLTTTGTNFWTLWC